MKKTFVITKKEIQFIKSLRFKKNRIKHQCFIVESDKNVSDVLLSDFEILEIFATTDWILKNQDVIAKKHKITNKELERISTLKTPNSVLAVVKIPEEKEMLDIKGINVVLENIQDPGNFGTIIRTCDWFGIQNIYCSESTVDVFNPKVVQSSMGSITRVSIHYLDLYNFLKESSNSLRVFGTFVREGESINSVNYSKDCCIVFGNESHGISDQMKSIIHHRITIPKKGNVESLNVAISLGIVLYKILP